MEEGAERRRIVVVARVVGLGPDALCAFFADETIVRAAISEQRAGAALAHIGRHVRRGDTGAQLCGIACSVPEPGF